MTSEFFKKQSFRTLYQKLYEFKGLSEVDAMVVSKHPPPKYQNVREK